ncbi:hypothetical protein DFQ11_101128 [Winogradskyella epiphytica]|uniref:Uncharacterized protein n=1 Tax=Winogradskyella epiphytica TaxID=262005 RepID=A0A2V4YFL8_9FLAO|nr:hypothetical protein DFQ11_101128 [Winogradskyella epiphytica]
MKTAILFDDKLPESYFLIRINPLFPKLFYFIRFKTNN